MPRGVHRPAAAEVTLSGHGGRALASTKSHDSGGFARRAGRVHDLKLALFESTIGQGCEFGLFLQLAEALGVHLAEGSDLFSEDLHAGEVTDSGRENVEEREHQAGDNSADDQAPAVGGERQGQRVDRTEHQKQVGERKERLQVRRALHADSRGCYNRLAMRRIAAVAVMLTLCNLLSPVAGAAAAWVSALQPASQGPGGSGTGPKGDANQPDGGAKAGELVSAGGLGAAVNRNSEVDLEVSQFGLGGAVRPGDWVGVQVGVVDRARTPRNLLIRLSTPDPDSDTTWWQVKSPAASEGRKVRVWVYARMPSMLSAAGTYTFRVQAFDDPDPTGTSGEAGGEGAVRVSANRVPLAELPHRVGNFVDSATAMMAVVGTTPANLDQYTVQVDNRSWAPRGHELVGKPIPTLKAEGLPDRWMGLSPFSVIAWTGSGTGQDPSDLSEPQAQALREWVQMGGHLVVVLPAAGQLWLNPSANRLFDIMPRVRAERRESFDLNRIRRMLVSDDNRNALPRMDLNVLEPLPGAAVGEATREIESADGEALVVSRTVGAGKVTLVGVDVGVRALGGQFGLRADVFWHRVLGRRGAVESAAELQSRLGSNWRLASRAERQYDAGLGAEIQQTGKAALGVLLAFVLFAAYWIAAGPASFALLKRRGRAQHAWLAFVIIGAGFTAVAWSAATWSRPVRVEGRHFTVWDYVEGQNTQRMRSFLSLLLPNYGERTVRVTALASDKGEGAVPTEQVRFQPALAPWDRPGTDGAVGDFPDARGYAVDARSPGVLTVPTRATTKLLRADWAGPNLPGMPIAVAKQGEVWLPGVDARLTLDSATNRPSVLSGHLMHRLPGALRNVRVFVVERQDPKARTDKGDLLVVTSAFALGADQPWGPDQPLDMAAVTAIAPGSAVDGSRYLERLVERTEAITQQFATRFGQTNAEDASKPDGLLVGRMEGITFLPVLPPPSFGPTDGDQTWVTRRILQGADLGRFMTGPVVIVLGTLEDSPIPLPVTVSGEDPAAVRARVRGRTMVRYVYPLPDAPMRLGPPAWAAAGAGAQTPAEVAAPKPSTATPP